jgi:hypothetical protein
MNWMAVVALHATLTFGVLLLMATAKLVVWLATRRHTDLG